MIKGVINMKFKKLEQGKINEVENLISYEVEDVASKDSKNTVLSAKGDFKESTTTVADYEETDENDSVFNETLWC